MEHASAPTPAGSAQSAVKTAAFFDVDNTLMRGSSMYYMGRGLVSRGVFTPRQVVDMAYRQTRFIVTGAEGKGDLSLMVRTAQNIVRGRPVSQVIEFGREIFESEIIARLWPEALSLIGDHQSAGREVWLVTSSGQELADLLARHLHVTGALGTRSEVADGFYTGELAGPIMHGKAKAVAIEELANDRGIDLSGSYAYSDSANDIPMLSRVGHPVAVNPDRSLRQWARSRGVSILHFEHPTTLGRAISSARRVDLSNIRFPRLR